MKKRLVVLAVSAAAIIGLTAGPASASSETFYYYNNVYRAYGQFTTVGDEFRLCDMRDDVYEVFLQFQVPSTGRNEGFSDTNGPGGNSCVTRNTNIGEGRYIEYRICLMNHGSTLWWSCSTWVPDWA